MCNDIEILLVDGDPVFRGALAENLRLDGHVVSECFSGAEALVAIHAKEWGVLISEFALPGQCGVNLADAFSAHRSGQTLLVTADSSGTVSEYVDRRPYVQVLRKPVSYRSVHRAVHAMRDRHRVKARRR